MLKKHCCRVVEMLYCGTNIKHNACANAIVEINGVMLLCDTNFDQNKFVKSGSVILNNLSARNKNDGARN